MSYAGIDVAKLTLDLFRNSHCRVPNTDEGFAQLAAMLPKGCIVVMESTGGYERTCADALRKAGFGVCVVNPMLVAAFRRSLGRRAKTDFIDARVLAMFGEARKLAPDQPCDHPELKAAVARLGQLRRMVVAEKNRLKLAEGIAAESVARMVALLAQETGLLKQHVRALIRGSRELARKAAVLTEIKGIGEGVASTLLAAMPEIGTITGKQAASLAGLAPHAFESGAFKGRRRIGGGRSIVRSALYLAAMAATRTPGWLQDMYRRLRQAGKPAKAAIIACARRLLVVANAKMRDLISLEGGGA
jgi:transposase